MCLFNSYTIKQYLISPVLLLFGGPVLGFLLYLMKRNLFNLTCLLSVTC